MGRVRRGRACLSAAYPSDIQRGLPSEEQLSISSTDERRPELRWTADRDEWQAVLRSMDTVTVRALGARQRAARIATRFRSDRVATLLEQRARDNIVRKYQSGLKED